MCTKVQRAIVVTLTWALASHFKVLRQSFFMLWARRAILYENRSCLARLYENTRNYCCHPGIGMGFGVTLKSFMTKFFLCNGQGTVRVGVLYPDGSFSKGKYF